MKRLDTPTKRVGAIFVAVGVLLMLTAGTIRTYKSTLFGNPYYQSPNVYQTFLTWLEKFTDSLITTLTFETWSSDFSILMLIGLLAFIIGMLMSYLYDMTIGRIIAWIKVGTL